MIHETPQDKPAGAGMERHLVVTAWDRNRQLPDVIAEALDAAGIDANVSQARREPPGRNRDGFAFGHARSVRQPSPTVTVELPRALAETLGKEHPFYLAKEGPSAYDARHAIVNACREALRSSEDSTEPTPPGLEPALRKGARVLRTTSRRSGDGGTGWQYERGAVGIVSFLSGDGIHVLIEGEDDPAYLHYQAQGDRSWAAGTFKVIG